MGNESESFLLPKSEELHTAFFPSLSPSVSIGENLYLDVASVKVGNRGANYLRYLYM